MRNQWLCVAQFVAFLAVGGMLANAALGQWWTRPWDYKVSPNPDKKRQWYLPCVNDMGGTPAKDNQRDISKSLGRIRKFRVQTIYRINELRDISELLAMSKGPAAETIAKAAPMFDKAETLIKQAIALQKSGKTADARAKIDSALKLLSEGETVMETAIAVIADRRHVQHLRNAAGQAGMDALGDDIDKLAAGIESAARARVGNQAKACAEQKAMISLLRRKLRDLKVPASLRREFRDALDLYEYLLLCVSKSGNRQENFGGEKYLRDAETSDLELGAVSTVARRVEQLRFRLRQLSNRMSAAAGKPVTDSISDRISAKGGFPIDDLDYFTRSKFGIVRSVRLMDNHPWDWEFNYTPTDADAFSVSGWWAFKVDPKFDGQRQGYHKADFDDSDWAPCSGGPGGVGGM